jgi:ABC-type antimicrobial peptide transport system permease subunit
VLFEQFQRAAADIDRDAVINPPRRVVDDDRTLPGTRFLTWMLAAFAAIAAGLAMLGIYGVTAYAVQRRRKEVAIRTALGASRRALVGLFLREGALLLGVGTAAGLAGSAAASRVLRTQIFGVEPFDLSTYAMASVLLLSAGVLAMLVAARGAGVASPVGALNSN